MCSDNLTLAPGRMLVGCADATPYRSDFQSLYASASRRSWLSTIVLVNINCYMSYKISAWWSADIRAWIRASYTEVNRCYRYGRNLKTCYMRLVFAEQRPRLQGNCHSGWWISSFTRQAYACEWRRVDWINLGVRERDCGGACIVIWSAKFGNDHERLHDQRPRKKPHKCAKNFTLPLRLSVRFCMKQTVSNRMHHDS